MQKLIENTEEPMDTTTTYTEDKPGLTSDRIRLARQAVELQKEAIQEIAARYVVDETADRSELSQAEARLVALDAKLRALEAQKQREFEAYESLQAELLERIKREAAEKREQEYRDLSIKVRDTSPGNHLDPIVEKVIAALSLLDEADRDLRLLVNEHNNYTTRLNQRGLAIDGHLPVHASNFGNLQQAVGRLVEQARRRSGAGHVSAGMLPVGLVRR